MKTQARISITLSLLVLLAGFGPTGSLAAELDWSKVPVKQVKVFYPGQASWDFLRGADHGTGAAAVRTIKKACVECHVSDAGEYDVNADKIITGELLRDKSKAPLEPQGMAGAPGFKDVAMQVAYDANNLYLRFQWQGTGASVADPALEKDDKVDRISVQIADKIKTFHMYGCFITCHDNEDGMPENRGSDVTLYGYYTRDKNGNVVDQGKLDGYLSKGQFIDLIEAYFVGKEVKSGDMHILDKRQEDNNDVTASGFFENGKYTVVLSRKLSTGDKNDITLESGKAFDMAIAIHDNKNRQRRHYVSFPLSVGLGAAADVSAQKF
jgi:cytochrome c-type protein NapC